MSTSTVRSASNKVLSSPRGLANITNIWRCMADPLSLLSEAAEGGEDIILLLKRPVKVYLVTHPSIIQDVLVTQSRDFGLGPVRRAMKMVLGNGLLTSEGEFHLRQRRIIQGSFRHSKTDTFSDSIVRRTEDYLSDWQDGDVVDLGREMQHLTLGIAVDAFCSSRIPEEVLKIEAATSTINQYLSNRGRNPIGPLLHRLPLPSAFRFRQARRMLDDTILGIIAERQGCPAENEDLLTTLLETAEGQEPMSPQQIRDHIITFMAAGHQTNTNLLTWTWYLMAQHPEVEHSVQTELGSILKGRSPSLEDLPLLVHLGQVLTEGLRLYPPSWATLRTAEKEVYLGGHKISKGAYVIVSQYVTQRDGRWFTDPHSFNPGRWTSEFRSTLPRFAYFPFGGGPRQCIGESLAWMEAGLVFATLA